jgi:5-methylcytosine-specific restriction endonuclease McrA
LHDWKPDPKPARQRKPYRRRVASAKQWARIVAEKIGPCRVCGQAAYNGGDFPQVQFHHVVKRADGGDDVAENIIPLCLTCHDLVTRRMPATCLVMLLSLEPDEHAYMIERGGKLYAERGYGLKASELL